MMKVIIVTLLAISATIQTCNVGCLKCSTTGDCLIADLTLSYYLNGTTATKSTLSNCDVLNHDGTCALCSAKYYLNPTTAKCVVVPTASVISNCEYYSSATSCFSCISNNYLSSNACNQVTTLINNCSYYQDETTCQACKDKYVLSLDAKSCTTSPDISKCSAFSFVKCNTCDSGYVLNPNNYIDTSYDLSDPTNVLNLAYWTRNIVAASDDIDSQNACQAESTENCDVFDESTNTCTGCSLGSYLDANNMCIDYPDEPSPNCLTYTNKNNCTQCEPGYYFVSNKCTQITNNAIPFCGTYDGTATTVKCLICTANYYLDSNTCKIRTQTVTNCATYETSDDICAECTSGYRLTTDGLKCNQNIAFCAVYDDVLSTGTLTCNQCISEYYLATSTQCLPGNVQYCDTYADGDANTCNLCKNGRLLQTNTCVAHKTIPQCDQYSTTVLNECDRCIDTTSFNFEINKSCQQISTGLIENCIKYSGDDISSPTCDECIPGYYIVDGGCTQNTFENCAVQDGTNCAQCELGYALSFDKSKCVLPFDIVTDQCASSNVSVPTEVINVENVNCQVCKENATPFNFVNQFICIADEKLSDYSNYTVEKIIPNCLKYNPQMMCLQCDTDSATPFLTITNLGSTCVASCANGMYLKYYKETSQFYIANLCANDDIISLSTQNYYDANCQVYSYDVKNPGDLNFVCIKCKDGSIPVVDITLSGYSNANPNTTSLASFFPSPFTRYSGVSCVLTSDITTVAGVSTQTPIPNCTYYIENGNGNYSCLKCDQGYTGTYNVNQQISTCTRDTACTTTTLRNLDKIIADIASCHICETVNNVQKIPIIAYSSLDGTTDPSFSDFLPYSLTVSTNFEDATGTEKNIACRTSDLADFGLSGSSNIGTDCGIGAVLTNTDGTGLGNFCVACKPGYKASAVNQDFNFIKTTCSQILNCTSSSIFNGCTQCANGYILKADPDASNKVFYDTCLQITADFTTSLANCYAATPNIDAPTQATNCVVCKKGFFLNADNICESFNQLNCTETYTRFADNLNTDTLEWALALNGTGFGCNKCNANFTAIQIVSNTSVCLSSNYVATKVDNLGNNTRYVPHCKNYRAEGEALSCDTCDDGYTISGTGINNIVGNKCFINTNLSNCTVAGDANNCVACSSDIYGLVNGKCVVGNIQNCVAYNRFTNQNSISCKQCAREYFLNTNLNICVKGIISNCEKLGNDDENNKCEECSEGYVRLNNILDGLDYCYPVDANLGCGADDLAINTSTAEVTCLACTSNTTHMPYAPIEGDVLTLCSPFTLINNCAEYNVGATLDQSNFLCNTCSDNFYVSNNTCVARINKPAKCSSYDVDTDTCISCNAGSYLSADKKSCIDNPTGIYGCRVYSNSTTCASCKVGTYLKTNACNAVSTPIQNCTYYSADNVCSACAANYVLVNNACVQATASNCVTYTSQSVCATCPNMYILQTSNGITSCVSVIKTGCVDVDINAPNNCLECSGLFYLDAGECKAATTILNCLAYDSATTCSLCGQGFAISVDKKTCTNTGTVATYIDENCVDSQVVGTPICAKCESGYYFVNGACTGSEPVHAPLTK